MYKISRFKQIILSKYATDFIPQEPENLRLAHIVVFKFLFGIFNNNLRILLQYIVRITSPELQPMACSILFTYFPSVSRDNDSALPGHWLKFR